MGMAQPNEARFAALLAWQRRSGSSGLLAQPGCDARRRQQAACNRGRDRLFLSRCGNENGKTLGAQAEHPSHGRAEQKERKQHDEATEENHEGRRELKCRVRYKGRHFVTRLPAGCIGRRVVLVFTIAKRLVRKHPCKAAFEGGICRNRPRIAGLFDSLYGESSIHIEASIDSGAGPSRHILA